MDYIINALIFFITILCMIRFFRKDGRWTAGKARDAFRFFTVQSNVFCAVAALLMCIRPEMHWIWVLKYIGTAAVSVTMLTVFLFLGPTMGYGNLLKGPDFFMHLGTPLLAIFSFSVPEKRGMSFSTALLGMLPVILYGLLYMYMILFAPEEKSWEDFYGFNRGGKWPVAFAAMLTGTLIVCLALRALQNA